MSPRGDMIEVIQVLIQIHWAIVIF